MAEDFWGNAITARDEATVAAIGDFSEGLIKFDRKAAKIIRAAKQDPSSALANAYAAMLLMWMETANGPDIAAPFLAAAEAGAGEADDREKGAVEVARRWVARDIPGMVAVAKDILEETPSDLVMVKLRQSMCFDWGDATGMLHSARYGVKAFPNEAWALGMLAFGQEESHLLKDAEATSRRALELDRTEGWAQHALAHVMLTEGRCDEGRGFLAGMRDTWEGKNSVLYCHNWWHSALFAISEGDMAGALAVYDDHITGVQPDYSQDQINEISLLGRLELAGCDVGDRWTGLADRLETRTGDFVNPFLTLQYLYALARAGRSGAQTIRDNMVTLVTDDPGGWSTPVWRDMGIHAADGMLAHAAGRFGEAADKMGRALPLIWKGGGSHAQRDLFNQIHLDAVIRAGRYGEAQQILMGRLGFEPDSVPNNRMLMNVYENLGLPEEAAALKSKAMVH